MPFSFSHWERVHTVLSLTAVAAGVLWYSLLPLAFAAAVSFSLLGWGNRGSHSARVGFGLANTITSARLLLTLGLMLSWEPVPGWALAATVFVLLILDGVDGKVARSRKESSTFGAHFDVEVDAMMVTTLSCMLLLRGQAGYWVLLAGLWRYIYLATVHLIPPPNAERTRTLLARSIYVVMTTCFAIALGLPSKWAHVLAAMGTLSVSFSFAVSFWDRYSPRRSH